MPLRVHGLCQFADGAEVATHSLDQLRIYWADPTATVWVDVHGDPGADLGELRSFVPDEDTLFEDCFVGEPRPRVEDFGGLVFLLMHGALGEEDDERFSPRLLALLVSERKLLTVHEQEFRGVTQVRARFSRYLEQMPEAGALFLAARIARATAYNYHIVLDVLELRIGVLEGESLLDDVTDQILVEISEARRDLLEVRQAAFPQREVFRELADEDEFPQVPASMGRQFGRVADQFAEVVADTDSMRERLREVRWNYESQVAERTNEIVRVLTLLSGILLPLTLISGIYGMNVPLWPPADEPASFLIVLAVMGLSALLFYLFFRRKNWL